MSEGTATASSGRIGCKDRTRRRVVIVIAPTMAHDARPMWEGQPYATLCRPLRQSWCLLAGAWANVCIQRLERLENLIHFDVGAVFQLTHRGPGRNRAGVGCPGSQQRPLLRTAHCGIVEDFIGPLGYRTSLCIPMVYVWKANKACHLRFSAIRASRTLPGGKSQL
ncbi:MULTISPECIES: hypothetical protein [Mesorhizobium]|nr:MULTISPECIES: hypothetical protein [Mesorhizobium]